MTLDRVRVTWTGFNGGPGVSTFYFQTFPGHEVQLQNLFGLIGANIPDDVHINVPTDGDTIDVLTGNAVGNWTGATTAEIIGGNTGGYASPVGAMFRWSTGAFFGGRRLRGKTFVVPCSMSSFEVDGGINTTFKSTADGAAASRIAAFGTDFVIYKRPRVATPAWTDVHGRLHPAVTAAVGAFAAVSSGSLSPQPVVLRSRRD